MNRCIKVCLLVLMLLSSTFTSHAGQVVVRKSSEPFDAFAVRDQVKQQHEWQEALRYQQQIQILQSLPLGCVFLPIRYYRCGHIYYRPYQYQQQDVYIQVDPPQHNELPVDEP
ncbi:hypothetical protein [Shewanella sp. Scap07]|uniref:hypothetical protein n=1 Tax=Shewanella sp. Scap07 TaxID=2589987 RepID=UPI003561A029